LFLKGGIQAVSAMWYNEYHSILNSGLNADELTTFHFRDHGIAFPEDGIYSLRETYQANPDICRRFAQASLKGWRHAFAHKEQALDIIMKYSDEANVNTNRTHQRWMLARMEDLIAPGGDYRRFGRLSSEDYLNVCQAMVDFGLIDHFPTYSEFCVDTQ
ncbi:MAG: ABC transporter substrate-binding protein, partial [Deltaproteobacteria bacterium]|nr:ABC transporter substrate-binding protein [Deltaproteobacteria bacterium]